MKKIKFEDTVIVDNIKLPPKPLISLMNKTPSSSILDEIRSVTKTDVFVLDHAQKIYSIKFFDKVKQNVMAFAKKKNHSEIRITNFCYLMMKKEDQIDYHSSFESNFVGIHLLDSPEKNNYIMFYDNEKKKNIKVKLKQGDLAMFPSYLLRKFPNMKAKKMYTYVVFDFHLDRPRIND